MFNLKFKESMSVSESIKSMKRKFDLTINRKNLQKVSKNSDKKMKKPNSSKIRFFNFSIKSKSDQISMDIFKNSSNLLSSTMVSSVEAPKLSKSCKSLKKTSSIRSMYLKSSMITRISDFDKQESFYESSDESDMSFDDDSTNDSFELSIDDLDSSLSSVSSLEFEPFESNEKSLDRKRKYSKSVLKPRFEPIISSSRSNLMNTVRCDKKSKILFQPYTTSSRKSLLIKNDSSKSIQCSVCLNDQGITQNHVILNDTRLNQESFDGDNILSSTVMSVNTVQQPKKVLNSSSDNIDLSSVSSLSRTNSSTFVGSNSISNSYSLSSLV